MSDAESWKRRGLWALAAGLTALLVMSALALRIWGPIAHQTAQFSTEVAQISTVDLPDGSKMTLAGNSLVNTDFSRHERDLTLVRGQAFFEVAKDPSRPFVVHAGAGSATAVGTRFDVNKTSGLVTVTVVHGLVRVAGRDNRVPGEVPEFDPGARRNWDTTYIGVGEQVAYSREGDLNPVREVNASEVVSWRHGVLTFIDEPLTQAIDEINRYAPSHIYYRPEDITAFHVSGVAFVNRTAEWIDGLEKGFNLKVIHINPDSILIVRRQSMTDKT